MIFLLESELFLIAERPGYVGIFLQDGSIFQNDEGRKTIPEIVHLFAIKNTLSFVLSSFA